MTILLYVILVVVGLFMLAKGADFLVDGSSIIARKFKIPEVIIGLTIVAIGTSLPELFISTQAALSGQFETSMSNVVGSNFANLFLIISLCAIIKPLHMKKQSRLIDQPLVLVCTLVLYFFVKDDGILGNQEGLILLGITAAYILYTIIIAKFGENVNSYKSVNEEEINKEKSLFGKSKIINAINEHKSKLEDKHQIVYAILAIVFGVILLKFGGDFTVDNASNIAYAIGLSKKLIGVTIVAFGTSLPELITCLEATKKGEQDLAIGNIAGSQIFNIILILGTASAITPLPIEHSFLDDIIILIAGNFIFFIAPFLNDRHRIGRTLGLSFVIFYFAYMTMQVLENLS